MSQETTRAGTLSAHLEALIDELIKARPAEDKIRQYMTAAGLAYTSDSVSRMTLVLTAVEELKNGKRKRV